MRESQAKAYPCMCCIHNMLFGSQHAIRGKNQFRALIGHATDLWCTADSASRQRSAHHVPGIQLWQQFALHSGGDVHDVAVPLHLHEGFHIDGAHLGHFADIVSAQINQHDML